MIFSIEDDKLIRSRFGKKIIPESIELEILKWILDIKASKFLCLMI